MAKIGTRNGSNGRERVFAKRQERASTRSATANATMPPRGSSVQRAKERLGVPHANAGSVANTTPEQLGKHKGKADDESKTGMVKRRVNALVEPDACKRRHGTRTGKLVGKPPLTDINRRAGKDANPKRDIDHLTPPWAAAQTQKPPQRCLSPLWWFWWWLFGALHDLVEGNAYGVLRRHPVDL